MPKHMHNSRGRCGNQYRTCNTQTRPDPNSAPPAYSPSPIIGPRTPYYHESPDETTSLIRKDADRMFVKRWFLYYALPLILMVMCFAVLGPMVSTAVEVEMAEWKRVHKEMVIDIGLLREEKRGLSDDIQQLQIERDAKRREWKLESEANEKRRRGHVPFWGEPRLLNEQCPRDRFRRYEARMYNLLVEDDWNAACMRESITIAGRTFTSPRNCINYGLDNGVRGYWSFEVNTRECPRTIWDRLRNIFPW